MTVERSRSCEHRSGSRRVCTHGTRERGGGLQAKAAPPPGARTHAYVHTHTTGNSILNQRSALQLRDASTLPCDARQEKYIPDLLFLKKHMSSFILRLTVEGAHRAAPSSGSDCAQWMVRLSSAPPERANAWT